MLDKYTTLRFIVGWAMITVLMAWWSQQTQESWTFYIVVTTFAILVIGLIVTLVKWLLRKRHFQNIDVRYLIPKSQYKLKTYKDAPEQESYPNALTVGVGNYILILELISEIDILFDPLVLLFEGNPVNAPEFLGKDNPFIIKEIGSSMIQDWHGQISHIAKKYPRYLYKGDCLIDGNRIVTYGEWQGKLHIRIPIREAKQIEKYLEFKVSKDIDDIPFLRVGADDKYAKHSNITNIAPPAATTMIEKDQW